MDINRRSHSCNLLIKKFKLETQLQGPAVSAQRSVP